MVMWAAPREPSRIVEQRDTDYLRHLGRNLKAARVRSDQTQEELARAIDMNPRQYARLEAGAHDSGILKYAKAMQATGRSIHDLFVDVEHGP